MKIRWKMPHWVECDWGPWSAPIEEEWSRTYTNSSTLATKTKIYTKIVQTRSCLICNIVERRELT